MSQNNFEFIGNILKTKGFDGTTVVQFNFSLINQFVKAFFIKKGNLYTPLLIDRMEAIDKFSYYIKWCNYPSKEIAQRLNNTELYIHQNLFEKHFDPIVEEDYIGYEVFNGDELLGTVSMLYENNFQETIEVELTSGKKLLIPLIDQFIVTINEDENSIHCLLTEEFLTTFTI